MRAAQLEPHDLFEGVGAHELNLRYDHVDGGDWDGREVDAGPALIRAQSFAALAAPPSTLPRLDGHDGSHHQTDAAGKIVDIDALRAATWIIWWKATQSTGYVDPSFADIRARARSARFELIIPYHWHSSTTPAAEQARHYLETVVELPPGEGAMSDAEEGGITEDSVLEWCETVEDETHKPSTIYTGIYVAGGSIWRSTKLRMSKYGPRPMHVAAYIPEAALIARMSQLGLLPDYPYDAWQFGSDGPVPGILGADGKPARADKNRVDNRPAFQLAVGAPATLPPPPPPPLEETTMNLYAIAGANARFIGTPALVRWTGAGDDKIAAMLAGQIAAGNLVEVPLASPASFAWTILEGPLPSGDSLHVWTGDEFANTAEIQGRSSLDGLSAEINVVKVGVGLIRAGIEGAATELGKVGSGG